ncbi:hypothetical protein AAMO2058_000635900 [Amorphochlora amoebiformis]|mmetsp:Transcript_32485/g.52350  ORF Transcript_32485/g.52350 Transcript_32485/m.52350 type:complete len:318 (-) Transcript_32485:227-1180(-)
MKIMNADSDKVFYLNDADSLPMGMLGLDTLLFTLALVTVFHATLRGGEYVALTLGIIMIATFVEEASVNNGIVTTHCHDEAILMITKCSSFNSILFYLPWLYTAIISARKLGLPVWAYPSAAALFTCLFGTCYEMLGPHFGWWKYNDEDVANGALTERIWGMPLMGAVFHPAMGFGLALAEALTGYLSNPGGFKWILMLVLTPLCSLLIDVPVRIANTLEISKYVSCPLTIVVIFVFPTILGFISGATPMLRKSDPVLFSIPFLWASYFISVKSWDVPRGAIAADPGLFAVAYVSATMSVVIHVWVNLFGSPKIKTK